VKQGFSKTLVVGAAAGAIMLFGCPRGEDTATKTDDREPKRAEAEQPEAEEPAAPEAAPIAATTDDVDWGPCPEYMPEGCGLAVLQGNPAEKNADVFFRLAPGTTAPNHWHSSIERMVLVSGELTVDYVGQDPVVLTPGTYAYGPAGLEHDASCADGDEPCVLFIAFEDPVDAVDVKDQPAPGSDEKAHTLTVDDVTWGPCPELMPEGCNIAVLNGDPSDENADLLLRLAPGFVVPKVWHTSAERMLLTSGEMTIDFDGHDPLVLTPGTYAYGPAKLPHDGSCADGDDPCVLFIAFEDPVDSHLAE
jgi:quercetin dioxygenase-like cupin family protein